MVNKVLVEKMKNEVYTPYSGKAILVGILVTAIWLAVAVHAYNDSKNEKNEFEVHAGTVTYGTSSSASMPVVSVPMSGVSAPMVSGSVIRHYAYSGHATMPQMTWKPTSASGSGYRMHTTSSATVHSIGGGGSGGGGGVVSGGSNSNASSRGFSSGSVSIAIPSLALATPSVVTTQTDASASTRTGMGPRKAPGSAGTYEGEQGEEGGKYWIWDGEEWIEAGDIPVGTTKIEDGITYRWNGSAWETVGDQADPGMPVGNTPWLWMLFIGGIYVWYKRLRFSD